MQVRLRKENKRVKRSSESKTRSPTEDDAAFEKQVAQYERLAVILRHRDRSKSSEKKKKTKTKKEDRD